MLKKFLIVITMLVFVSNLAFSATSSNSALRIGIQKYKARNYAGCALDMKRILKEDPSNAIAHYYAAISYARLGNATEATNYYTKVIELDTDKTLSAHAQRGLAYLTNQTKYAGSNAEVEEFLEKKYKDGININLKKEIKTAELEQIRRKINADVKKVDETTKNKTQEATEKKENSADEKKNKPTQIKSSVPTNEEIANAFDVLYRAGINPFNTNYQTNQTNLSNPYNQLNMLMGNQNNNNNMNMINYLPMMLQSGQNQQVSKEFIQTMMMSQMMPDFSFDTNKD